MSDTNAVIDYDFFGSVCGTSIEEAQFNEYVIPAQSLVDLAALGYDMAADVSTNGDNATYRANYYKRAVAYQTAYMADNGAHSIQDLADDQWSSITVGRTSLTKGSTGTTNDASTPLKALSIEARAALMMSGLLHSGGVFSDRLA